MKTVDRFYLYVNSKDRAVGAPNNLTISLPEVISKSPLDIVRIYIQSLQIPNDFPRITSANSTFLYNGSAKTIPTGSPNVYDIQTSLKAQGVEVVYDRATNRYKYPAGTYDFRGASAASVLGFANSLYTLAQGEASPRPIDVSPTQTLFINSSVATRNYKVVQGKLTNTTILASCPIVVPPYSMIVYQDLFGQNSAWQRIQQLDTLRIWITDDDNNLVPLDSEWTMTIALEKFEDDGAMMVRELKGINSILESQLDVSKTQLVYKDLERSGALDSPTARAQRDPMDGMDVFGQPAVEQREWAKP